MIDSYYHVAINGIRYRIKPGEDGYRQRYVPLRPANAQLVQGAPQGDPKFQLRPDRVLWTIDDWSGGEGLARWNPGKAHAYFRGNNIDPFIQPGSLLPGRGFEDTSLNVSVRLLKARGRQLFGVEATNDRKIYIWDDSTESWDAGTTITTHSAGEGAVRIAGHAEHAYWGREGTAEIHRWDESTFETFATDTTTSTGQGMIVYGSHLYMTHWNGKIFEWDITDTVPVTKVEIYEARKDNSSGNNMTHSGQASMCAGDGKVYACQLFDDGTSIVEITPTTAAGTGFGRELVRIPGFYAEAIWYHMGFVFMAGHHGANTPDETRMILYVDPVGSWGAITVIRPLEDRGSSPGIYSHYFAPSMRYGYFISRVAESAHPGLWAIDVVTGAVAHVGTYPTSDDPQTYDVGAVLVEHGGSVFFSSSTSATNERTLRTVPGEYYDGTEDIFFESPVHDFGVADVKVLESLEFACDPLPANWAIVVKYDLDQSGTWTTATTYSTTNGTGTRVVVTTDSATKTFRTLQLRVEFTWAGGSNPTSPFVLRSMTAVAKLEQLVPQWDLTVLVEDETAAQDRSLNAKAQVANLETLGRLESAVAFLDGYISPIAGESNEYDVYCDGLDIALDRVSEGEARVVLTEVAT